MTSLLNQRLVAEAEAAEADLTLITLGVYLRLPQRCSVTLLHVLADTGGVLSGAIAYTHPSAPISLETSVLYAISGDVSRTPRTPATPKVIIYIYIYIYI